LNNKEEKVDIIPHKDRFISIPEPLEDLEADLRFPKEKQISKHYNPIGKWFKVPFPEEKYKDFKIIYLNKWFATGEKRECKRHAWIILETDDRYDICANCEKKRKAINIDWKTGKIWRKTRVINFSALSSIDPETGEEIPFDMGDKGKFVEDLQSRIQVNFILDKLSPRQQKVIEMRMEGFKPQEIAKQMKLSTHAVYWHIKKAKEKVKDLLKKR